MTCLCEEGQQEILAVFTVVVELGGNRGTEAEQDLCIWQVGRGQGLGTLPSKGTCHCCFSE